MLVKTEEISDRPSGNTHSMIGLYKHRRQGIPYIKNPDLRLTVGCHISDAPALCDWAFPFGCLTETCEATIYHA